MTESVEKRANKSQTKRKEATESAVSPALIGGIPSLLVHTIMGARQAIESSNRYDYSNSMDSEDMHNAAAIARGTALAAMMEENKKRTAAAGTAAAGGGIGVSENEHTGGAEGAASASASKKRVVVTSEYKIPSEFKPINKD